MKIGLVTLGSDGGRSGIGRYTAEMIDAFRVESEVDLEVVGRREEEALWVGPAASDRPRWIGPRFGGPLSEILWVLLVLPVLAWRRGWEVAFFPAGNRRLPLWMPCPTVGTVHDVAMLHVPRRYGRARELYVLRVLPWLIRRLTRVVSVSRTSALDIEESTGIPVDRIEVIANGVDHDRFHPRPEPEARARLDETLGAAPYLLYVARIEHPSKNHLGLIEAFERFRASGAPRVRLVLAGGNAERADEVHARIAQSPVAEDIVALGFVPDADLPELYRGTAGAAMPSFYEGFGIPAVEALACGVPVAVSDCPALVEVAGAVATVLPARDPEAWAGWMSRVTAVDGLDAGADRRTSHALAYDWRRSAAETLATIRDAVRRNGTCRVGTLIHAEDLRTPETA